MAEMGLAGLSKTVRDALGSLLGYVPKDSTSINWSFPLRMHSVLDWKPPLLFQFSLIAVINTRTKRKLRRICSIFLSFPHYCLDSRWTQTAEEAGTIKESCYLVFSATFLLQPRFMCPRVAIPEVAWVLYINYQLRKLVYTGTPTVQFHRCNSSAVLCLPKHVIFMSKISHHKRSSDLIYKEKNGVAKFLLNE